MMATSGVQASPRSIRPSFAYLLIAVAAVTLLLTGFAIGSSWAASQQLRDRTAVGRAVVAGESAGPQIPESQSFLMHGDRPATGASHASVAGAALPLCGTGIVRSDNPTSIVRGSACTTAVTPAAPAQPNVAISGQIPESRYYLLSGDRPAPPPAEQGGVRLTKPTVCGPGTVVDDNPADYVRGSRCVATLE